MTENERERTGTHRKGVTQLVHDTACYHVPYLSPLLFHISILGSGRDELDQQTEFSAQSDYILSFYCLCLRMPPCHSVNPVLIVYLHISPLGSSYCFPPYISLHKP